MGGVPAILGFFVRHPRLRGNDDLHIIKIVGGGYADAYPHLLSDLLQLFR